MDEFTRAMVLIIGIGLPVVAIGVMLVYFTFRAFGESHHGGNRHFVMLGALIAYVIICCGAFVIFAP